MFATRMRRLLTSVSRQIDVWPDTLVIRAWEGLETPEPAQRSRA
ncbi:MAG: hypothetical protein ACKO70_13650 [Actinomycetota bacterium]